MVSGVSQLSTSTISVLFSPVRTEQGQESLSPGTSVAGGVDGYMDAVFKAGDAVGNIIAIAAGMKDQDGTRSETAFSMDGAIQTDFPDGGYELRKTGTGTSDAVSTDPWGLSGARIRAQGSGAAAESAKSYIKAVENGSIEQHDMRQFGVTSTMTQWEKHDAQGGVSTGASFAISGMDQFYKDYIDTSSGAAIFKPTGQYVGIGQNGTVITLSLWT